MQGVAKHRPTEKQIDTEIQATLKHAPARKLTEDKMTQRLHLFISLRRDYSFSFFVVLANITFSNSIVETPEQSLKEVQS